MLELLKEIILDSQNEELFLGTQRHLKHQGVKGKAFVCIGVRRCGKSTLMAQIMSELAGKGVSRKNILYLNFFDDRLDALKEGKLNLVTEAFFSLYPEKKTKERIYFFFDELQEMPGWEKFVDRLLRTENCDVFISGSSAKLLSKEISTHMRGRSLTWELFPFSFAEFLDYNRTEHKTMTSRNRHLVQNAFDKYFTVGGFPEVMGMNDKLRIMTHQEYFNSILHRDIIERFDAIHPKAVVQLGHRLVNNVSSLHSLNRLTDYLKSSGYKLSKAFVKDCLEWSNDAFLFFPVKINSPSVSKQNANPQKIYAIDHSLVKSMSSSVLLNNGHLLENLIFCHLRRKTDKIWYHRTASGKETDFVYLSEDKKILPVQVCYSLAEPDTKKRELSALAETAREIGSKTASIVTYAEEESLEIDGLSVKVIPAWKYCI